MSEMYHKIQSIFKRDFTQKNNPVIYGEFSTDEIEFLKDCQWEFTEKVDGTNIRIQWDSISGMVYYGGRTNNAQIPTELFNHIKEKYSTEMFTEKYPDTSMTLYGEGYGAKIQKVGHLYSESQKFVLFDIRIGDYWLQRADVHDIANVIDRDVVPIIGSGTLQDGIDLVSRHPDSMWGDFPIEGVVARPAVDVLTRQGKRIIVKIKCRDFPK